MSDIRDWQSRIDREAQRRILIRLAESYPQSIPADFLYELIRADDLAANASYLHEHGLIEATFYGPREQGNAVLMARLTHAGMDFIRADGGLTAILGVVTVKIHEDTIKDLIAAHVTASPMPQADKKKYLDQLRELPAETTKHLALKMVDAGLSNWPKALQLLQSILG